MNLSNLISNEEPIGGLEIVDDTLRFSRIKQLKSSLKIELLSEEKIASHDIAKKDEAFAATVLKFAKKNKIKYVIVSIPADDIFVKIYDFPAAMPAEKIAESMGLTIDLQLPKKKEEIYCDWMEISNGEQKKILLSYITRDYINKLLLRIKKAGLKVVAIESHPLSFARAISQKKDESLLITEKGPEATSFSVLKNNQLLFSQSTPNDKMEGNLAKEINKIVNYHDWFSHPIKGLVLLGDFTAAETKKLPLKIIEPVIIEGLKQAPKDLKWLIPLGAALRGLIPRKEDTIISFMELGTETAYRQEKAKTVINLFLSMSIALAVFFVVIFVAAWSTLTAMQNNYSQQITAFNLSPSAENSTTLRDKADAFNELIKQTSSLVKTEAYWSKVVSEIKDKTTAGVVINNLSLPSVDGQFSITGLAVNREAINVLKKSFESSELFSEVNVPLTNLGKKAEIPFSLTFKIKDSQLIYSK